MEEDDKSQLFALMDKYPEVVLTIMKENWGYRRHLVLTYIIEPFKKWCTQRGYVWRIGREFENQDSGIWFGFSLSDWNKYIAVRFNNQDYSNADYGIGVPDLDNPYTIIMDQKTAFEKYKSWSVDTAEDIISGRVFDYVCDKLEGLLKEVKTCPDKYHMK